MASLEEKNRKRPPRKLVKKKRPEHSKLQYPRGLELGEDADEDVTMPQGQGSQYYHLNQSVFSIIAAAGSKSDFHGRFDEDSSGSDTEQEGPSTATFATKGIAEPKSEEMKKGDTARARSQSRPGFGQRRSESKLLRSLPKLNIRTKRERNYMSQSMILPPKRHGSPANPPAATPRDAPVMSRILEAQAQLEREEPEEIKADGLFNIMATPKEEKKPVSLEQRLMEIFGLKGTEEVVAEYPCWLLQSVLLQGYMYITSKHICFYAYLPKKSTVVAKSGHLAKRGKSNPRYNRYWFRLQGDVLSYYTDSSNLYFPNGNIDLRYGISAALSDAKEKSKDTAHFTVTTHARMYHFKADSPASAKEWVRTLQKVIFRSRNEGDSVKISLPLENVVDIEESPVIDFADTFKIRVIDNDETFAIDEYFFSFFSFGKDALNVLRALVDNAPASRFSTEMLSSDRDPSGQGSPHPDNQGSPLSPISQPMFRDSVKATLSPGLPLSNRSSPRVSGEWGRRSFETSRRSMEVTLEPHHEGSSLRRIFGDRGRSVSAGRVPSLSRKENRMSQRSGDLSDSYVHSIDPSAESSTLNMSTNDNASASQILSRSDVFRSPTMKRFAESPDREADPERDLPKLGHSRTESTNDNVLVSPPSRSATDHPFSMKFNHHAGPTPRPSTELTSDSMQTSQSAPSFQQYVKHSLPMQKAAGFAGYLRRNSRKMSALLATESMGYVEKVSGMWAGGWKHYGDAQAPLDELEEEPPELDGTDVHGDRFRAHFALPETEKLQATYFGYLFRVLPLYGKIYIGDRHFCFRSLLPGTRTKLILPLAHIENVNKERGFTGFRYGLVVAIRAYEELLFEFSSADVRDVCTITLLQNLETVKTLQGDDEVLCSEEILDAKTAQEEHKMLQEARLDGHSEHELSLPKTASASKDSEDAHPILFDDPRASIINFKPTESFRITCLTIGSRGDVQPYIALAKGLMAQGHKPRIATHREFEPWIRKHGIDFAAVEGDPAELMRICVENGMFTYSFLKEASVKFRGWIDELLSSAWKACQDSDILIESPSAMAGIHIAEALEIPYFRAFGMPWTRTRAYPHAFAVPERKMGGAYNYITYVMFDNVFWTAIAGQVNRWRKKELGLRSTNLDKLHPNKVPFLYNFSPSVVSPPLDYSDWIRVTGYWFLDEGGAYSPPPELAAFIRKARQDRKKLVYIGFGSIVVSDPAALTRTVVDSVVKADVRCILSKGWSDRLGSSAANHNHDASKPEVPLPPEIFQIKSAPHDWLFKQIDAAVHHGGAGTTGASLRAGLPTIIKPFFGDQFFFGSRVEDLGVGICMKKLNVSVFSRALWEACNSERMVVKARVLGEQIRKENGVETAIQALYRDLEYARTLIKRHNRTNDPAGAAILDNDLGDEESWTFIGDESDPELLRRIAEWEPYREGRDGREGREGRDRDAQPRKSKTEPLHQQHGAGGAGAGTGGATSSSRGEEVRSRGVRQSMDSTATAGPCPLPPPSAAEKSGGGETAGGLGLKFLRRGSRS